jgi:hypothetical protein
MVVNQFVYNKNDFIAHKAFCAQYISHRREQSNTILGEK